jgi:ABC-type anion transport system duplicated permease subunit
MDIITIALAITALLIVVFLVASFLIALSIFLGPPDGFDIDLSYSQKTKESEYDDTEHKTTFRKKLR